MRRILNLCLVGFTTAVSICWTMDMAASCITSLNPALRAQAQQLDCLQKEIHEFGVHLDAMLKDISDGRSSLRAASQTLEEYAAQHYPTYFNSLAVVEPERPMRVKLACMLLSQIELDMMDRKEHSVSEARRDRLKCEYAEISAGQMDAR